MLSPQHSVTSQISLRNTLRNYVDSLISRRFGSIPIPNQKVTFSQDVKLNKNPVEEESKAINMSKLSDQLH